MSRRLLIFLFILIVLIFLLLLMLNGRDDERRTQIDLDIPTARQVKNWLTVSVKPEEIRIVDENQGCRFEGRTFIIPAGVRCLYVIPASTEQTKQIKLHLSEPALSIRLELEQDRALTVEEELLPEADPLFLDIYRHEEGTEAMLVFFDCVIPEPEEENNEEKLPCHTEMQR